MKIICIGDSITRGYGVSNCEAWVELLNEKKEMSFINKGINGDTSDGMLARFQKDVIEEKPRYVLIMGGANDLITGGSPGSAQTNIMAMVHQAYHYGIIPVVGISIKTDSETFREDWAELTSVSELNILIQEYRNLLLKFCRIFRVSCIDFYSEFDQKIKSNYSRYLLDGLHPTREGHKVFAEIAYYHFAKITGKSIPDR
jgi:acyl-CoA thioesterase I